VNVMGLLLVCVNVMGILLVCVNVMGILSHSRTPSRSHLVITLHEVVMCVSAC